MNVFAPFHCLPAPCSSPAWRSRIPVQLPVVACVLLFGCNAFDAATTLSDESVPASVAPPSGGISRPIMIPIAPSATAPPGSIGVPGCSQCGSFCADCGRGCECKDGHTPFDPPPWNVPFSDSGPDGWKDSDRALCAGMDSVLITRLWAGDDGVYVRMGGLARSRTDFGGIADDDAGVAVQGASELTSPIRTRVLHNGGAGWALRAEVEGSSMEGG